MQVYSHSKYTNVLLKLCKMQQLTPKHIQIDDITEKFNHINTNLISPGNRS